MTTTRMTDRNMFRCTELAVLVDASAGIEGALATTAVLDQLIYDGRRIEYARVESADAQAWTSALRRMRSEFVAVVDAGLLPDSDWVSAAIDVFERNAGADAVAANVVDAETGVVFDRPAGLAFTGHLLPAVQPPAVNGRTMVLGRCWVARRDSLLSAGGFDPFTSMPAGFVDLAWRFWLTGKGVEFDPDFTIAGVPEVCRDHDVQSASGAERDAMVTIFRNYDERNLHVAMRAARSLVMQRMASISGVTADHLRALLDDFETVRVVMAEQRRYRQASRMRPDAEIVRVFGNPLTPDDEAHEFVAAHHVAVDAMGTDHVFAGRHRVVVVTADTLGAKMAGPGIRALRIAESLAGNHDVRLASTTAADLDGVGVDVSVVDPRGLAALVEWSDIVVFQGWVFSGNPALRRPDRIFLVDVYDPMHLEQLEQARDLTEIGRLVAVRSATAVLSEQLVRGDSFFCASGKQRDFWLGQMAALGRINPAVYDDDPSLDTLITEVPFGISDDPPVRTRAALKGVVPGIGEDDGVILGGGGVYNWFDPLTLIRAVDVLRTRCDDVRLVFLGMKHPNPDIPEMRMAVETRRLAEELGLVGSHVFFNEEWVEYTDRQNYLLDADVAVTTHLHHVETEFSFRTRVLDYFWAGIPTVATSGDALADLIDQRRLGLTVPPGDVDALTEALFRVLEDRKLQAEGRANIKVVRESFLWSNVLAPIAHRCAYPKRAPDLIAGVVEPDPAVDMGAQLLQTGIARDLRVAYRHLRDEGPMVVLEKVQNRLLRQFSLGSG